jgi:MFS family permease
LGGKHQTKHLAYAIIGTTMWPLVGTLVPEKNVGKVFGLMFATQQLGLTIAAKLAGIIVDNFGFVTLELFFVVLQGVGAFGGFLLIGLIGKSTPKDKKDAKDPMELEKMKGEHE